MAIRSRDAHGFDEFHYRNMPRNEIVELAGLLSEGDRIVLFGAEHGTEAFYLARHGCQVRVVDPSPARIDGIHRQAGLLRLPVEAAAAPVGRFVYDGPYEAIVSIFVLHALPHDDALTAIDQMQEATVPGGYNLVDVFSDAVPAAGDMRRETLCLFARDELRTLYAGWEVLGYSEFVFDDFHGEGPHQHGVAKILARRPAGR